MFLARFSYDILPADREKAVDLISQEVAAARKQGLTARLLVPLTRPPGAAGLQFEVELVRLDQLDILRHQGFGNSEATADWARRMSDILQCPPHVELLKVAEDARKPG